MATEPDAVERALARLFEKATRAAGAAPAPGDSLRDVGMHTGTAEHDGDLVSVRSAATLDRQIVVRSGWAEIVLDITPGGGREAHVQGQVLGPAEVCAVQLLRAGIEVALTTTDDLGEFSLGEVPPGSYALIVAGSGDELTATIALG